MNIPGTRIPVTLILAYARDSKSEYVEHLLEDFPVLSRSKIEEALEIAIEKIREESE